ncbi:MAG: flavin reductase family protein [Actinomycetota bacterium]|nr:flavin reductase family protein [Actinomycetota bacterium]
MIDPELKRCLGQMIKGVQVVGAAHDGVVRAYTSHWVTQVSFTEPIVMASMSPRHDTHPLVVASGVFGVSLLAADQIAEGQYFSYPGRRFRRIATEMVELVDGVPSVVGSIAWLRCEVEDRLERYDHDLFFARVTDVRAGRLKEPPLLYSSRLGWRATGERARERGRSIRDELLARLQEEGGHEGDEHGEEENE